MYSSLSDTSDYFYSFARVCQQLMGQLEERDKVVCQLTFIKQNFAINRPYMQQRHVGLNSSWGPILGQTFKRAKHHFTLGMKYLKQSFLTHPCMTIPSNENISKGSNAEQPKSESVNIGCPPSNQAFQNKNSNQT